MTNEFGIYTSVMRDGNDILLMGYSHDKEPIKKRVKFEPELFLPKDDGTYTSLLQKKFAPKKFDSIGSVREYVDQYKELYSIHGISDMSRQYVCRNFRGKLSHSIYPIQVWWFDIETKVSKGFPKPETAAEQISLITLFNRTSKKIYTWSLHAIDDPTVNSGLSEEEIEKEKEWINAHNVDFRSFSNEESMLLDFLKFVHANRLDILSGWNSDAFDIPYLFNRLVNVLGESMAAKLSPWKIIEERTVHITETKSFKTYDIGGINHLDLMELYKKFNPGSKESFSLDFISNYELGEKKVELPGEDFKDSYSRFWATFVRYNIQDVLLLEKLDRKKQMIELCLAVAYMAKCSYSDVFSAMRTWECFITNSFYEKNMVEPWSKTRQESISLPGAYVHDPKAGRYRWVVSVDATALYPSIMMQNNLSPETIISVLANVSPETIIDGNLPDLQPGTILSANGLITTSEFTGFIPELTRFVFDGRKEAKDQMLDLKKKLSDMSPSEKSAAELEIAALNTRQSVLKVLGNSLYGVCALKHFRYYNFSIASAITLSGQLYLKKTMKLINDALNKIAGTVDVEYAFYGDTDSIFFTADAIVQKFWSDKDDKTIVGNLEKFVMKVLQPEINSKLVVLTEQMGAPETLLNFKLEGISKDAIWLAKKRYIAALMYNEGVWYDPIDYKIMGMEIVRSSTPKFIKKKLKEAVEIIVSGKEEDLHTFVENFKVEFMKQGYDTISFPRGCNGIETYRDATNIFKPKTPQHVRGALIFNSLIKKYGLDAAVPEIGDGDRIKFILLRKPNTAFSDVIAYNGSKIPEQFDLEKFIDWNLMFDKVFIGPLEGVLEAVNWTTEEQNTLDF